MDVGQLRRWIRLKMDTIETARVACLSQGDVHHQKGRELMGNEAKAGWAEAERFHSSAKDIRDARYEDSNMKHCSDDSVHDNSAPVQITRFHLPKDAREIITSVVAAIAVITSLVLWGKLHDAEKDIQTQVWLRDDALTKFEQGPFADTKAHVLALELNCKEKRP